MLTGLLGGALIGLAATVYLLATGRVAGVSGILAGALGDREARRERLAFLAGLIGAGLIAAATASASPAAVNPYPTPVLLVAGVLVGFGTRLGRGCTSGHGVCGVSRLSIASLVATTTFIAAGAATVAIAGRLFLAGHAP
jgi:uncharacterized membrane protein YedE/YeeE